MTTATDTTAARIAAIEAMQQDFHEQCAEHDRATGMRPGTYTEVAVPLRDLDFLLSELTRYRTELERIAACEPAHRARIAAVLAGEVGE